MSGPFQDFAACDACACSISISTQHWNAARILFSIWAMCDMRWHIDIPQTRAELAVENVFIVLTAIGSCER
jgi:hypothetical protein